MRQGLGRCVLTLRKSDNIEQYREIVLWGCLHNLSYDTQCEGTRAAYIYQLASCFHDDAYFIAPTIDAFQKLPRHLDWTFCHFFELLRLFAEKGSVDAKNALYEKYDVSWLLLPLRDASGIAIAYIDFFFISTPTIDIEPKSFRAFLFEFRFHWHSGKLLTGSNVSAHERRLAYRDVIINSRR